MDLCYQESGSFICSWTDQAFSSLTDCYHQCGVYIGDKLIPLSPDQFYFLFGLFGILLGLLLVEAIIQGMR